MSEAQTPETGALTVDQAVASLLTPPVEDNSAPEAPVEAAEEPQEPQGEASSPEETEAEPETPAEGEEADAEVPAVEPVEPPKYWSKDAKEAFSKLDPELQAVVLAQEGPREEAAAKAKADAAEARKVADAELSKVQELAAALEPRLQQWIETFTNTWGTTEPDWAAVAQEHGVEAAQRLQWQFNAQKAQLQEAANETSKAKQLAHQQFVKTEFARLAEIEPDLAPSPTDPKQGAEARQKVTKFLIEKGIPEQVIAQISALEMSLAYDAMRYREGKQALSAAPKPKPAAPQPRAQVRPGAAAPQSSQTSRVKEVTGRFHAKPTIDNAVALLLANQKA